MSDLRESGSIEQDADVIMLLHREEYYHPDDDWRAANPDKVGVGTVEIANQRNGPTGRFNLTSESATTRFRNYSSAVAPEDFGAAVSSGGQSKTWTPPPDEAGEMPF